MAKAPMAMLLLASSICVTAPAVASTVEVTFSKFGEMGETGHAAGYGQNYSVSTNNKIWAVTDMSVHITGASAMEVRIDHVEGTPQGNISFSAPLYLELHMGGFEFILTGQGLSGSSYMYDHLQSLHNTIDVVAAQHKAPPVLYGDDIPISAFYYIGDMIADSECYLCQASARPAYSSLYTDTTLTITYTEVPEPSSGALLGLVLLAGAAARRRGRARRTPRS